MLATAAPGGLAFSAKGDHCKFLDPCFVTCSIT